MSDLSEATGFFGKFKKDPIPAIGMAGFFGVVVYSALNYRKKSADLKPSVYVIQTRVAAQGLTIACLAAGACIHMYQSYSHRDEPKINAYNRGEPNTSHKQPKD
jgi:hypothetical protein